MNAYPNKWQPIREIKDWSIGGPADRLYDNPEQAKEDLLSLLGVEIDYPAGLMNLKSDKKLILPGPDISET